MAYDPTRGHVVAADLSAEANDDATQTAGAAETAARPTPTPAPDAPFSIVANGLSKSYGDVQAVSNLTLRVREGEFYGFLGPNGAGKSTTIRMLCGQLRPSGGDIAIAGFDLAREPLEVKRRIGVLPEETSLYERLTAAEFLVFAGQLFGLGEDEARRRADSLLELMELSGDKDKLIVDYSMGMKKKTALAAALIHSPKVIFLDEPFNGIDPVSVRAIRNTLRHLTARGTTIFFSSHVMEVVEKLCTRVAIIDHGQIVAEGTIPELRAMAQAGGHTSLEDIFLTLVHAPGEAESLDWLEA